ncbi:hypothetical protein ACFWDI_09190 [Streptomyces sp. NPDC060064]|uniref:hypothetical protein n=1 Tax=Streptomyces sp. NPDC060064 TaxID=3347049 RepID=UPI0036BCDAB9
MRALDVTRDPDVGGGQGLVVLDVESDADPTGCPDCGVVAVGHGRHHQTLHDAPSFGTPVRTLEMARSEARGFAESWTPKSRNPRESRFSGASSVRVPVLMRTRFSSYSTRAEITYGAGSD